MFQMWPVVHVSTHLRLLGYRCRRFRWTDVQQAPLEQTHAVYALLMHLFRISPPEKKLAALEVL